MKGRKGRKEEKWEWEENKGKVRGLRNCGLHPTLNEKGLNILFSRQNKKDPRQ